MQQGDKVRNRATGDAIGTIRAIRPNGNILVIFDLFSLEGLPSEFSPASATRTLADLWETGKTNC